MSMNILFIAVDPEEGGTFNSMCMYEYKDILYLTTMLKATGHNVIVCNKAPRRGK